jgi:hypothetical protein
VPEVCRIFCATANPVQVIIADRRGPWHPRRHRRPIATRRRRRGSHAPTQRHPT